MSREITVKVAIVLPALPNFLRTADDTPFDVADVSDEGLREIGAEWTEALVAHAQQRRAARAAL